MKIKTLFASTIALTLVGSEIVPQLAQAEPALTIESRLGTNGIGPVHVGMTASEAQAAAGRKIIIREMFRGGTCADGTFRGLDGVSVMLIKGIIERVDISNPEILTLRGAAIGDTESRIRKLYPGQIETTRHPYGRRDEDHYLTFYPKDREDRDYRLIFETYNGKVRTYRGGRLPAVEAIEGCA
jgi:hypothetical protein